MAYDLEQEAVNGRKDARFTAKAGGNAQRHAASQDLPHDFIAINSTEILALPSTNDSRSLLPVVEHP
jgi:hypothetical protein